MAVPPTIDSESLLVHAPHLRALAQRLVGDAQRAEDLVQETWVQALENPPSESGSIRGWLTVVLRNLAFQSARRRERRETRERTVARSESSTATAEAYERFALHRELVETINALGEPYRETIVLRYFDDLPPREIAARLDLPVKTVKTRLSRGLELLRGRLDRRHGTRSAWIVALAPLAEPGSPAAAWPMSSAASTAIGALAVNTSVKVALVALVATGALYLALPERDRGAPTRVADHPASETSAASNGPMRDSRASKPTHVPVREAVSLAEETPAETEPDVAAPAGAHSLRGRVFDALGVPASGVDVGFRPNSGTGEWPRTSSGPQGRFELEASSADGLPLDGTLMCVDERFATVFASRVQEPHDLEGQHVLVIAPRIAIAGAVVEQGTQGPVPRASTRVLLPPDLRSRFTEVMDRSFSMGWSARTDPEGRFSFEDAPAIDGARVVAARTGLGRGSVEMPLHSDSALWIELSHGSGDAARGPTLEGQVIDPWDAAVPGAMVALGSELARTDERGFFQLEPFVAGSSVRLQEGQLLVSSAALAGTNRSLTAVAKGWMPTSFSPERSDEGEAWPDFVILQFAGEPLSISGRVFGTDGQGLGAARVWTESPDFFSKSQEDYLTLEKVMRGDDSRWSHATAEEDGRFELTGLGDRDYVLCAMDPRTMLIKKTKPLSSGIQGIEIRLDTADLWGQFSGQVVDRRGTPVASARVVVGCIVQEITSPSGSVWTTGFPSQNATTTDAEGRFVLEEVPRAGVVLSVHGESVLNNQHPIETLASPVVLEVGLRYRIQLELVDGGAAGRSFRFFDASGNAVLFQILAGGSITARQEGEFTDGRSPVVNVPETASEVVLYDSLGAELRRINLALELDRLNTLRL